MTEEDFSKITEAGKLRLRGKPQSGAGVGPLRGAVPKKKKIDKTKQTNVRFLAALTVLPQDNSQVVVRLGADVHQDGRRAGRAEAEGHLLLGQVDLVRRQAVVHDPGVPTGPRHRFGQEVILDQRSRLEETPDVWKIRRGDALRSGRSRKLTTSEKFGVTDSLFFVLFNIYLTR